MEWAKIIEAGAMIGQRPAETLSQTLPELTFALRGWQRARGINPDDLQTNTPMSHERLLELAREYGHHEPIE